MTIQNVLGRRHVVLFLSLMLPIHATAVSLIPAGLNPGDQFRLVFVTDSTTNAFSGDINYYNGIVDGEADTATALLSASENPFGNITWYVIASTSTVDARDNTMTNDSVVDPSVPIFLINNANSPVALTNADLWDGDILNAINSSFTTDNRNATGLPAVWTGTTSSGVADLISPLGSGSAIQGYSTQTNSQWIAQDPYESYAISYLYGLSEVLEVPTVPVPEPPIYAALLSAFGLIAYRRYQVRKA